MRRCTPAVSDVKSWAKVYDVEEGTGKIGRPESIHRLFSARVVSDVKPQGFYGSI